MKNKVVYLGENIKFLRQRKKKSQQELAEALGMTRVKLNSYENTHRCNMPAEDLLNVADYFKMSVDTLLKVRLQTLSELKLRALEAGNDVYMSGAKIRVLAKTVDEKNKENIEVVNLKARAGYTNGYADPEFVGALPRFQLPTLNREKKYRMFQVSGDSMLPVPDGSFVIAEYIEDWRMLREDEPCIVLTKNEGIVFKILRNQTKKERQFVLHSLNPLYEDYTLPVSEIREIWKFTNFISSHLPEEITAIDSLTELVREMKQEMSLIRKKL